MTIRAKLTLWYAVILSISVLLIVGLAYQELVVEKRKANRAGVTDNDGPDDAFDDVAQIVFTCGLPAALLGLAGGWWLTRRALAPVAALTDAAAQIHERNLHEQLPRSGNGDELDRLTEVFNGMTTRLNQSFQRIHEFTLHASHELKTPLTILHGELETALRDDSPSEPQRERILSQLDEIQRLTKIVDGLSLLTKADAGEIALQREPVRLDEVVRDSFEDAQILAEPQNLHVELAACEEIKITGDRHRLRQLLLNLTDNAIKYNKPGGNVTLALRRAGDFAELTVANTGPGLAPELQPRVFERFFRGDASHNSTVEGCGLGLSIAQWITHAHGGTIQFASEPGQLTTITVRMPATESHR
ncbi:MAG: HAMP domain-containing protein [Verrucomicrobia bacterium]|nr:HAMP domain-containing protein [Verrucomicrobiota bacterium]